MRSRSGRERLRTSTVKPTASHRSAYFSRNCRRLTTSITMIRNIAVTMRMTTVKRVTSANVLVIRPT
jgi:hypothetical protein